MADPQEIAEGLNKGHRAVIRCVGKGYFDGRLKHLPDAYPYLHILGLTDADGLTSLGCEVDEYLAAATPEKEKTET